MVAGRMVLEDKAMNTVENTLFTANILAERAVFHVVLVTADYHIGRGRALFRAVMPGLTRLRCRAVPSAGNVSLAQLEKELKVEEFMGRPAAGAPGGAWRARGPVGARGRQGRGGPRGCARRR